MKKSTNSPRNYINNSTEAQSHSFKEEFSKLNEDLQVILQHVKDSGSTLAKDVSHDIVTRAENMMTHIADLNHKVGGSAADFLKNQVAKTKEKTKEYADDVEEAIKEHPLSSIVVSFGVGLILAKVLWPWHSSR
jgi:ElaB/YqjD/DUF883 family membrane-anchored ribosome-binding protein